MEEQIDLYSCENSKGGGGKGRPQVVDYRKVQQST